MTWVRYTAWCLAALGLQCAESAGALHADTPLVPTTRAPIGPNVYLETVLSDQQAVAVILGERLGRIGDLVAGGRGGGGGGRGAAAGRAVAAARPQGEAAGTG
jgi:hypothetical protein